MVTFRQKLINFAASIYFKFKKNDLAQETGASGGTEAPFSRDPLLVRAAAEGAILLKNNGVLPATRIALFGRGQKDTFYTGYGSGGDVNCPVKVSILEGLSARADVTLALDLKRAYECWIEEHPADHGGWGTWPLSHPEMPLSDELVARARAECDTAVVVIARAAGEDRDVDAAKGGYFLSDAETEMLASVKRHFDKIAIVLNIGGLMDLGWLDDDKIGAALLIWHGGMATGEACAGLLAGEYNPCGKLPDSVPRTLSDLPAVNFGDLKYNEYTEDIFLGYRYFTTFAPEKMLYPFGHGLSYTTFSIKATGMLAPAGGLVSFCVKNTGSRAGREVVEVYVQRPDGAARELAGFYKTPLLESGEECEGEIKVAQRELCSYDEARSCYVLRAGTYRLFAGRDALLAEELVSFTLKEEVVIEQLAQWAAPQEPLVVRAQKGTRTARAQQRDLKEEMLRSIPPAFPKCKHKVTFADVAAGNCTLEEFVSTLTNTELEAISRGDYVMDSPLGAKGNAGVMGGVLPSLREKGVPPVTMTDGPSGVRLAAPCSLVPNGTCLASTFDPDLVGSVYALMGEEMKVRGSHVLLAPGMNIHRHPLCGRNFEYFSEDPFLTGKIAAGAVRGIQGVGVSACPKHFACNNQESNRNYNDSRLSERALREIYLRAFEICVKEGKPHTVMTSYNKVNGVWSHYHFALVRGILRGEWGFDGCVVTDWWMRKDRCPQFPKLKVNAYRVRAGVNVLMPGGGYLGKRKPDGTLLKPLGKKGGIARTELQRNALEILQFVLKSAALCPQKKEGDDNVV